VTTGGHGGLLAATVAAFDGAVERDIEARRRRFHVADLRVDVVLAGRALERPLLASLEHLAAPGAPDGGRPGAPILVVRAWDAASSGLPLPPVPVGGAAPPAIAFFDRDGVRAAYNPNTGVHTLFARSGTALYAVAAAAALPVSERAAPLRTVLQWCMADHGRLLVHAAAVGRGGRGVLIAGGEGAGKSTTAWACLRRGMECAGDDYVAIAAAPPDRVYALYSSIKLAPTRLAAAGDREWLSAADTAPRVGSKVVLDVALGGGAPARSLALGAIVVVRVGRARMTTVRRASAADALKALAPTTLYLQAGAREVAFRVLSGLVRRLPCRAVELGSDLDGVHDAIAAVVEKECR
jgi:hypothetical protein